MRDPDDGAGLDVGVRGGGFLDRDRADPFAARLDPILGAVGDLHDPVGMHDRDIAGVEPAASFDGRSVLAEIARSLDRPDPRENKYAYSSARQSFRRITCSSSVHKQK